MHLTTDSRSNTANERWKIVCSLNLAVVGTVGNNKLVVRHTADTCSVRRVYARRRYGTEVVAADDITLSVGYDSGSPSLTLNATLVCTRCAGNTSVVDTHLHGCTERLAQDTSDLVVSGIIQGLHGTMVLATSSCSCIERLWSGSTYNATNIYSNLLAALSAARNARREDLAIVLTLVDNIAVRTCDTSDIYIATCEVRLVIQNTVVLTVLDGSVVDIYNPTEEVLAALALSLHHTRSIDLEVANFTTLQQLVEESVLSLPVLQGKAIAVEYASERLYNLHLLSLGHIDVGLEAHLALVILVGRVVLTFVDSSNKSHQILCVFDTTCIYRNYGEQEH